MIIYFKYSSVYGAFHFDNSERNLGEFPDSLVVRALSSLTAEGPGSIPGQGAKIPQAA